jgi:hypothetical protein
MARTFRWCQPYAVYDWDGDRYCLSSIEDASVMVSLPPTLSQRSLRTLLNEHLERDLYEAPFIVLRGGATTGEHQHANNATTIPASGVERRAWSGRGPKSDAYHVEDGLLMLHFSTTLTQYEPRPVLQTLEGHSEIMCDVIALPVTLQRQEVPAMLAHRRRSIGKQLRDRRFAVGGEGKVGTYAVSGLRMVRGRSGIL